QVTFFDYDDTSLSSNFVKEKTAATAPTNYTKTYTADGTHFTFSGWDADFSSITKVTSVHPTYSESYEVKFFGYGGEQIGETQIVAKNASATEPTEFDKTIDVAEGKQSRFAKWDKAFNKITAPTSVNAVFDTYYQVTFFDYDDTSLSSNFVKEKTAATAPTNYTKTYTVDGTHFTFSGWDADFSSITKVTSVHPTYSESYEVKFFGYGGEQIGETQIVEMGSDAVPPTFSEDFPEKIETSDGIITFKEWDGSYENIEENTDITAFYDFMLGYKLVIGTDPEQSQTLNEKAFSGDAITLPDTGAYSHLEGYNAGWFHSYSGLKPDTSAPITSYTIEENGETFVLLNYFTVPMTVTSHYEGELLTDTYNVTIYRHNDYGVLIKGSETEEAVNLRSPGYDTVYGFRVKDLTFHTKDGSHLTYDEFIGSDLDVTQIETISAGDAINIVNTE
ncbi:MAG: hypothetical protein K6F27_03290, partial [Ruminococcus sp.]|nr:hypothetical protein [Ruminococcus sp.]